MRHSEITHVTVTSGFGEVREIALPPRPLFGNLALINTDPHRQYLSGLSCGVHRVTVSQAAL